MSSQATMAFRQFIQQKFKSYKVDLTFEMVQVMSFLSENEGSNQQEIANATVKDKASLTYLIDNLTKRGLVHRREDEQDRRNKRIFLTEKGSQLLNSTIMPWADEMYAVAMQDVSPYEIQLVINVLSKITQNLKE
ncbi:MarR family winged helix-turn-helix transcriptional regulator [Siphonobacter curvatus]|uniref:MarR family transcriptional regulator n=1 Tax=Siphonobacter curvatus TaxID=2094562 RepID=A0A2S7IGB3_9BACT|nr:MarR family transcriptional regulator [Siphonobacter curvatus]PQA54534.1 MarR family transcriptional regulator [Siphonobacter curvatus]